MVRLELPAEAGQLRDADARRRSRHATSASRSMWSCSTRPSASRTRTRRRRKCVRALNRARSWALTGTPIENHPDDLVNIFAFIDPDRIPPEHAAAAHSRVHVRLHPAAHEGRRAVRHAAEGRSAIWKWNSRPPSGPRTRWPRRRASFTSTNSATRSPCSTSFNS